jgi:hypothetical protein
MAFAYTVDAPDTTGTSKDCRMRGNNYIVYTGTYTFTAPTTSGTIDLTDTTKTNLPIAASKVKEFEIHITDGTVTDDIKARPNYDGTGAAAAGKIGILLAANDDVGTWSALVVA